jgi:hypothetical protein
MVYNITNQNKQIRLSRSGNYTQDRRKYRRVKYNWRKECTN